MKVTGIHIEDFHQLKNLDIDLTYPKGHGKEGEPLEKVCIIGQSGTGKTKLLEIIGGLTYNYEAFTKKYGSGWQYIRLYLKNFDLEYLRFIDVSTKDYATLNELQDGKAIDRQDFIKKSSQNILKAKPNLISYPPELKYEIYSDERFGEVLKENRIVDFSVENASSLWNIILQKIQKYQEEELSIWQEISIVAQNSKIDIDGITKAVKKLEDWQKTNFNPIVDIAEKCLNPILEKFNLRVKTRLDIKKKEDIGFIKIEDFNGNEIPYGLWSTGTKQAVLSALPLYLLKPQHTIILFDEPERSLYPDLQRLIIDYYQQLTTDCQFFFATHSPIIASCFEPWEIVELKFNKDGHVYQEQYYEGERHVDNYMISPDYLTYDLMLSKVFDLQETHSPVREEKITEVLMLRNQLERLKKEGKLSTPQGEQIYERYMKLAQKLAWDFELPQYEKA